MHVNRWRSRSMSKYRLPGAHLDLEIISLARHVSINGLGGGKRTRIPGVASLLSLLALLLVALQEFTCLFVDVVAVSRCCLKHAQEDCPHVVISHLQYSFAFTFMA